LKDEIEKKNSKKGFNKKKLKDGIFLKKKKKKRPDLTD
jgi:hypothetical protein